MFAQKGAKVIDADKLAHEHLKPTGKAYAKVLRAFGKKILNGKDINRRTLAGIVFRDPRKLKKLTSIIHPIILKEVQARIKSLKREPKTRLVVVDAPLLIEAGWHKWVDYVMVVKASKALQIRRVKARKPISRAQILRRIASQMPMRQKINMADIVIDNRKNLKETQQQTHMIAQRLLARAWFDSSRRCVGTRSPQAGRGEPILPALEHSSGPGSERRT